MKQLNTFMSVGKRITLPESQAIQYSSVLDLPLQHQYSPVMMCFLGPELSLNQRPREREVILRDLRASMPDHRKAEDWPLYSNQELRFFRGGLQFCENYFISRSSLILVGVSFEDLNYMNNIRVTLKWGQSCHPTGTALHIYLMSQMLKQSKITFGLGLMQHVPQRTCCKDNKKAGSISTRLMKTRLKI